MMIEMLKAKIHRARITQTELDYVGSITIDVDLLEKSGIREYEKVQVVNITNGKRFETYTIAGERASGMICLNGAAAHCANVDDLVIIMSYAQMTPDEADTHAPTVVFVDENNAPVRITQYEKHGKISDL